MVKTTRPQREALKRLFCRKYPHADEQRPIDALDLYRRFRRTVQPEFGGPAIMVHWCGMWVGIERDGHSHT